MPLELLYRRNVIRGPAYQLRYDWTGWPSDRGFPPDPPDGLLDALQERLEPDGVRLLEIHWSPTELHLTSSTEPRVSPVTVASRLKGRLQHELRLRDRPTGFRRNFGLRAIGDVRRPQLETYIEKQVHREALADPDYEASVAPYTGQNESVSLEGPAPSGSGRYWYNLHLVFVVRGRYRARTAERLRTIHEWMRKVARAKEHRLAALSVMPDHVHAAVRPGFEESPEDVALAYMNNTAYGLGQRRVWEDSYYVGTFGEYDMDAIRW